jgi:bifunctional UDP-N-acetylglucosamine pyrophosphorylase/glucosamine-1-phosphate N-acetyltransferase
MDNKIIAVVMAAGQGSRMVPLTDRRPKPMIEVASKPMVEHLLIQLINAGIQDFIFIVGYRNDVIENYFGDGSKWNCHIEYVQQEGPVGTGHAVLLTEGKVSEEFLVVNADMYIAASDIAEFIKIPGNVLAVQKVKDVSRYGAVEVNNGYVAGIREKLANSDSRLASVGMYKFTREIFRALHEIPLSPRGEYELPTAMQVLIDEDDEAFRAYNCLTWWDVSYPWDLIEFNRYIMSNLETKIEGTIEDGVVVKGTLQLGKGSVIMSGCYIQGTVTIGENCIIEPCCFLKKGTSIGNNVKIGFASKIANSIIMDNTRTAARNYIADSVIGEGCYFGNGANVTCRRLDNEYVSVYGESTQRRKFGCVMGDQASVSANATVCAGSNVMSGQIILPGTVFSGGSSDANLIEYEVDDDDVTFSF